MVSIRCLVDQGAKLSTDTATVICVLLQHFGNVNTAQLLHETMHGTAIHGTAFQGIAVHGTEIFGTVIIHDTEIIHNT